MKRVYWLLIAIFALFLFFLVVVSPVVSQDGNNAAANKSLPLSEPGPYAVGTRDMTFSDESRGGAKIDMTMWYPAVEGAKDATPNLSGAPYPVVVYSHGYLSG